ncbi:MAG: hypothetical protein P8Y63_04705 [Deltaproteobacteria bacterium]
MLPSIYSLLRAGTERQIAIEVLSQLDTPRGRGIDLTPTQSLARGIAGRHWWPIKGPAGRETLYRLREYL